MTVVGRAIDNLLPSQEYLALEHRYILQTGHSPSKAQQRRWKAGLREHKHQLSLFEQDKSEGLRWIAHMRQIVLGAQHKHA